MRTLLTAFVLGLACLQSWAGTIYVKADASGTNDGTSWANAFTDLQSALTQTASGDDIWMAKGTYKPTSGTDRTISFTMKDGVDLYGGFAGTEINLNQRDFNANQAILSGEIGISGDTNDNTNHVVIGANNATFDGFTVEKGNAIGASCGSAGGIELADSNFSIVNCIIKNNRAINGAGISGGFNTNVLIANCLFLNNIARDSGGGYYSHKGDVTIENCTFFGNSHSFLGGAICQALSNTCTVKNCIVWSNTSPPIQTYSSGQIVVTYSDVHGRYSGTGNIDTDPLFNDSTNGDYSLKNGSPCINTGDPSSPLDPDGSRADMGYKAINSSPPDDGLVAYYPFNGNANDESGNGNNGTVNGATLTTDRFGNANSAYSFDGVDDFIEVPNSDSISSPVEQCTISSWGLYRSLYRGYYANFICKRTDTIQPRQYGTFLNNYNETMYFEDSLGLGVTITMPEPNAWYHYAISYNHENVSFYINGQCVGTDPYSQNLPVNNQSLLIGMDPPGALEFLDGIVDDIRIYNRALSAEEIAALYDVANLTMAVSPAGAGTTDPAVGTKIVKKGEEFTISATPGSGYKFTGWTAEPAGNVEFKEVNSEQLTVDTEDRGQTTEDSEKEENESGAWAVLSKDGVAVGETLSAKASYSAKATLKGDATITANFALDTADLTVSVLPTGSGITDPTGTTAVNIGEEITVSAVPAAGYYFLKWIAVPAGNAVITDANSATTKVLLSGNCTLGANFTTKPGEALTLTSPNGGEKWQSGTAKKIAWTSDGTVSGISIELLKNGSSVLEIASGLADSGSYDWSIPADQESGNYYKIKISGTSGVSVVSDSSDSVFSIYGASFISLSSPNGGESWQRGVSHEIAWTSSGLEGNVKLDLYKGGLLIGTITDLVDVTSGSYSWAIPGTQPLGDDYSVKATCGGIHDSSNANFAISDTGSAVLTMAAAPSDGGTTSPAVGEHSVNTGEAQIISAEPAEGYSFVRWSIAGDGTIANLTQKQTSATLTGNASITAIFAKDNPGQTGFEKVIVKLASTQKKPSNDSVSVIKGTLAGTVPAIDVKDFEFNVMLDDYALQLTEASGELKEAKTGVYKYKHKSKAPSVRLTIDTVKKIWMLGISKTDLAASIDAFDGIDLYLSFGGSSYGANIDLDENEQWKFVADGTNSTPLEVAGDEIEGYDILRAEGKRTSWDAGRDSFSVVKAGLAELDAVPGTDSVRMQIDGREELLNDANWTDKGNGKYVYAGVSETDGSKIGIVIDYGKGAWKAKISKASFEEQEIDAADGIDVYLQIGDYEGGLNLEAQKLSTMTYPMKGGE